MVALAAVVSYTSATRDVMQQRKLLIFIFGGILVPFLFFGQYGVFNKMAGWINVLWLNFATNKQLRDPPTDNREFRFCEKGLINKFGDPGSLDIGDNGMEVTTSSTEVVYTMLSGLLCCFVPGYSILHAMNRGMSTFVILLLANYEFGWDEVGWNTELEGHWPRPAEKTQGGTLQDSAPLKKQSRVYAEMNPDVEWPTKWAKAGVPVWSGFFPPNLSLKSHAKANPEGENERWTRDGINKLADKLGREKYPWPDPFGGHESEHVEEDPGPRMAPLYWNETLVPDDRKKWKVWAPPLQKIDTENGPIWIWDPKSNSTAGDVAPHEEPYAFYIEDVEDGHEGLKHVTDPAKLLHWEHPSCLYYTLKFGKGVSSKEDIVKYGGSKVFQEKITSFGLLGVTGFWGAILVEYGGALVNFLWLFVVVLLIERRKQRSEQGDIRGASAAADGKALGQSADNALEIVELTKKYSSERGDAVLANDKVSFDVKRGEIFCLLGHNGAGKTTLIKQLTGVTPATSGDAIVDGQYLISKNMEEVRRYGLSYCPQDNPHWPEFSMREHLLMFAACRLGQDENVTNQDISDQINRYAAVLSMEEKLDTHCKDLSGGQKRRLWVICALLGKAPVILLDELFL